jgi:hypothetical protein
MEKIPKLSEKESKCKFQPNEEVRIIGQSVKMKVIVASPYTGHLEGRGCIYLCLIPPITERHFAEEDLELWK